MLVYLDERLLRHGSSILPLATIIQSMQSEKQRIRKIRVVTVFRVVRLGLVGSIPTSVQDVVASCYTGGFVYPQTIDRRMLKVSR